MYKMIILFEQPIDESAFQQQWQLFMGMAEKMPRLRKEVVSRIDKVVFSRDGKVYDRFHELIFDSRDSLEIALRSREGVTAGKFLQEFTSGRIMIMTSEHQEAVEKDFNLRT